MRRDRHQARPRPMARAQTAPRRCTHDLRCGPACCGGLCAHEPARCAPLWAGASTRAAIWQFSRVTPVLLDAGVQQYEALVRGCPPAATGLPSRPIWPATRALPTAPPRAPPTPLCPALQQLRAERAVPPVQRAWCPRKCTQLAPDACAQCRRCCLPVAAPRRPRRPCARRCGLCLWCLGCNSAILHHGRVPTRARPSRKGPGRPPPKTTMQEARGRERGRGRGTQRARATPFSARCCPRRLRPPVADRRVASPLAASAASVRRPCP